jgi:hypothetical protein
MSHISTSFYDDNNKMISAFENCTNIMFDTVQSIRYNVVLHTTFRGLDVFPFSGECLLP